MNRLEKTLSELKNAGRKALIPFLTAGDPEPAVTEKLMTALTENGADVIELGIPYSDPLADGPVLQAAALRALSAGIGTDDVFALVSRFRQTYNTPVVLLVYYNQIVRRGISRFCSDAKEAGADALVVPDLTYEEAGLLDMAATKHGLINIRFLSPTTDEKRLARICKNAAGFIYCVTVTGVTGGQKGIDPGMTALLQLAKTHTGVPLALGFGIATPEQAAEAAAAADAVIVGSALVSRIAQCGGTDEKCAAAAAYIRSLKEAISGGEVHAKF